MAERHPNTSAPVAPTRDRESVFGKKDVAALLVGAVLIVLLYLGLSIRDLWRDELAPPSSNTPRNQQRPPATHQTATLVVGTVKVKPTKENGNHWDALHGHPDPRVMVVNRTRKSQYRTAMASNTLEAAFDARAVSVREGDEVYLRVDDVDVEIDDKIGEHTLRVTPEMLTKGELTLSFGQVKSLTLRFAR